MSSHDDIRHLVIRKLEEVILDAIKEIGKEIPERYHELGLDEYRKMIEKGEDVPLIIKNEKFLKGIGRVDIELFGGRILVEVKVKDSEFPDALKQLKDYLPSYPNVGYCIVTNERRWVLYEVVNHNLREIKELKDVIEELKLIVKSILVKGVRIIPSTENVGKLFQPIMLFEDDLLDAFRSSNIKNSALFEAYRNIITRLYEGISEDEIERLYIKHTLMQMIASACLTTSLKKAANSREACSGEKIEIEIILPYLKWWEALLKSNNPNVVRFLNSLLDSIYSKAMLMDWERGNKEDVFRELYEILIDADTRRKIGEYYTPLWLVEFMIEKVASVKGLKEKIVLDPFCGSGTFLVKAFYRKIDEGEEPDKAIREVIGFDILPLAVSIARAELMIAYQSVKKDKVIATPLIFNTDSASMLLRGEPYIPYSPTSFLEELRIIEEEIENHINISFPILAAIDISEILKIEMILREYFREAASKNTHEEVISTLRSRIDQLKVKPPANMIIEALEEDKCIDAIANLVEKYGNGVWAVSITSLFAPRVVRMMGVDIIVTNPPWGQLTEIKGSYGELLRGVARKILKGYDRTAEILAGADKASILLYECISPAKSVISFVMPREGVYRAGSYYGLGKILTYEVVKSYGGNILDIDFDVFQHGNLPAIVIVDKREKGFKCYVANVKPKVQYSKALHLHNIDISSREIEDYASYINNIKEYIATAADTLVLNLHVSEVVPMGDYIRGLMGGVKKKGAKKYAGLIFDLLYFDATTGTCTIKLSNTNSEIRLPEKLLIPYWKKLIYPDTIYPFYVSHIYDVILSSDGREDLRNFLENRIIPNILDERDKERVETLISEVKQPEKLNFLKPENYYVIYRRNRTFASVALTPEEMKNITASRKYDIVVCDTGSYLATESENKAYYYSAILNYLVNKVIEVKGAFERSQFSRPLIAILKANLEWKNEDWQIKVSELSKKLQEMASQKLCDVVRKGMQVKESFKVLQQVKEFQELIKTIDDKVDKNKLLEAMKQVARINQEFN
ncbi:MAG: N-6 DNA methylase [Nitrososphaeria archaeon]